MYLRGIYNIPYMLRYLSQRERVVERGERRIKTCRGENVIYSVVAVRLWLV